MCFRKSFNPAKTETAETHLLSYTFSMQHRSRRPASFRRLAVASPARTEKWAALGARPTWFFLAGGSRLPAPPPWNVAWLLNYLLNLWTMFCIVNPTCLSFILAILSKRSNLNLAKRFIFTGSLWMVIPEFTWECRMLKWSQYGMIVNNGKQIRVIVRYS